jgi:hypothetical protein
MKYQINFDGAVSSDLARLGQTLEHRLNGNALYAQAATDSSTSTVASGSAGLGAANYPGCTCDRSGATEVIIIVIVAVLAGATGYLIRAVKGPHK